MMGNQSCVFYHPKVDEIVITFANNTFFTQYVQQSEKRCIPAIDANLTYEMISFPPFFFQNQTSLRINISQYGYQYPDYIELGVSFSVLLFQVI